VGSSTGALSVLFLNARDAENNLYGADKLYEFYQQLHDSPAGCLSILDRYFGNRWLSEASTSLLIPAYNVGQKSPWFFDSEHAKLPSQNFKMRDIAYVSLFSPSPGGIAIQSQKEDREGNEATDHRFHNAEITHSDVTFEALIKALKAYLDCDFFIASLGIGETPRAFGVGEGYSFDTALGRTTQDRHLSQLNELRKTFKQEKRRIDYIRIQLTLGACSTSDKNALRQAGLYVSNPSGREYTAFLTITKELLKAYQEKALLQQSILSRSLLKGKESYSDAKHLIVKVYNIGDTPLKLEGVKMVRGTEEEDGIPAIGSIILPHNNPNNTARFIFKQIDDLLEKIRLIPYAINWLRRKGLVPGCEAIITFNGKRGKFILTAKQPFCLAEAGYPEGRYEYERKKIITNKKDGEGKSTLGKRDKRNGLIEFYLKEPR
ncbi:MAG: hypothetical protein K0M45_04045, partial [Candidatus Paracaedibacteraceae bacterium]|nr:hypothetical protein [Candidatus Paracaedibacteraceae bacterium]